MRNCQLIIHACKNITEKNAFIENVWTANLALFIYVSTHFVETVKWLDYNRYSQLTWWCSGNASALGARGPGFNPWLQQGFLCLIFCFVAVMFLLFYPKTHYLSQKFAILFTMLIYLVYLTYCKICDWLYGYKDTGLASLNNEGINPNGLKTSTGTTSGCLVTQYTTPSCKLFRFLPNISLTAVNLLRNCFLLRSDMLTCREVN